MNMSNANAGPLQRLVSLGGEALGPAVSSGALSVLSIDRASEEALERLLQLKNGFSAWSGALHVFPLSASTSGETLESWNDHHLWRSLFSDLAPKGLCFAEDVFGEQFVIHEGRVHRFNPETGEVTETWASIDVWASSVLADPDVEAGSSLASDWPSGGQIPVHSRLIPIRPFVAGGEYEAANLRLEESAKGMRIRAGLAIAIRDTPDGSQVRFPTS